MRKTLLSRADGKGSTWRAGGWRDITPRPGVSCRASPPLPAPWSLPDEGLWDILIKDIPKEVTSYTFSMDILKQGVSYDFRVIASTTTATGPPAPLPPPCQVRSQGILSPCARGRVLVLLCSRGRH